MLLIGNWSVWTLMMSNGGGIVVVGINTGLPLFRLLLFSEFVWLSGSSKLYSNTLCVVFFFFCNSQMSNFNWLMVLTL